jgi:hypothetical protein
LLFGWCCHRTVTSPRVLDIDLSADMSETAPDVPAGSLLRMSDGARAGDVMAEVPPRAHARIVYLGPVSPHWEVYGDWGDRTVLDEFRARVLARLVLLPRDDPQFRRNRERVVRDAEREAISLEWDLGVPDEG